METNTKIILLLVILLIAFGFYKLFYSNVENFVNYYNSYYKQYCPSCGWRNKRACNKCLNCGLCQYGNQRQEIWAYYGEVIFCGRFYRNNHLGKDEPGYHGC